MESNDTDGGARSRRVRHDKHGRLAAFEKLKACKGSKHKYEVKEESKVYEEVSEKEFSKIVQQRQEDDWIVDDNGSGYCEDGREIFDDDIEEDSYTDKKTKLPPKNKFAGPQKKNTPKSSDIKNMFKSLPTKRKVEDIKLEDDDILGSIMEDLHKETDLQPSYSPQPMLLKKKPKLLRHHSPAQHRFQANPFAAKQKTPLACDYVPKAPSIASRRPLQPKVVDFDNKIDDVPEVKIPEHSSSPSLDSGFASKSEEDSAELEKKELMDLDFDPSCDIFEEELIPAPVQEIKKEVKEEEISLSQFTFQGSMCKDNESVLPEIDLDNKTLPLRKTADGKSVFQFFWLDAFEDPFKNPGTVYLFGKVYLEEVERHVSCCVIVKNIPRRFFVLPRETEINTKTKADTGKAVTMQSVYLEIRSILDKMKITDFRSKLSSKKYAFSEAEIPDACEYLEVQYSAQHPSLPSNLRGATFSHVLGMDSSALEILLLEQRIKGPCWLDIHTPQISSPPISWCKVEVLVTKMSELVCATDNLAAPPVTLMCFNMVTALNSKTQQSEIVAASCLLHHDFPLDKTAPTPHYQAHFCVLSKPSDGIFPYDFKEVITKYKNTKVERVDSERSLLIYFLAKIHKIDPDILVGHDILGFDLDILLHRIVTLKIPHWSRIGRLKRAGMPRLNISQGGGISEKGATCGRLMCDIKISSKELLRCRSYDLPELSSQILSQPFNEIPAEFVHSLYNTSKQLLSLINHGMLRSELILRICCELNVLPLALQITNIAGCIMSRTLLGGRSERNEFLLLHAFHARNFIYPPKFHGKKTQTVTENGEELELTSKKGRKKPAYEGGLVLDPKKGFYDKYILLMDFNSLYPSIIQEYNICFTTVPRVAATENNEEEEHEIPLPAAGLEPGVLPAEIRKLVESRRQVKQMMKGNDVTKDKYAQYDIRQRALKLTANSMYGCLGFTHSRFYAKPLAALITRKGREILLKTKDLVEKMGLDVIYGDTDSIMINTNQTNLSEVTTLGNKVKSEINKLYRLLEIDIDGVYKPMLLLKKKKYAALSISLLPDGRTQSKQEIKGLDIVRRDWSQLAKDAGQYIIKEILSNKSKDEIVENIHSHLITLGEEVTQGKKPLSNYLIYKQLTKNPEDYGNSKNLPHVTVALRINAKGGKKLKMGDTVSYLICIDGSDLPATQRAYHPDELKSNDNLKIDVLYYLTQQIHPVISRLCAPIEGADAAMIAKMLGLDASKYQSVLRTVEEEEDKLLNPSSLFDDKERFKDCQTLTFKCPSSSCHQEIVLDGPFNTQTYCCQLQSCSKCRLPFLPFAGSLRNQLERAMRGCIKKYYQSPFVCEDVGCHFHTRKVSVLLSGGGPVCPSCKNSNLRRQYSDAQLYTQLSYYQSMFDLNKAESAFTDEDKGRYNIPGADRNLYALLKKSADKILSKSAYGTVHLGTLFEGLFIPDPPAKH